MSEDNLVSYEQFTELDVRAGTVVEAERVEGSDKLIKLQVDLGSSVGQRQIVAGIGKAYETEALIGKQIIVIVNLAPRKLMGLESQGMLLAAHDNNDNAVLLMPGGEVPRGSQVS